MTAELPDKFSILEIQGKTFIETVIIAHNTILRGKVIFDAPQILIIQSEIYAFN